MQCAMTTVKCWGLFTIMLIHPRIKIWPFPLAETWRNCKAYNMTPREIEEAEN